MKLTPYAYARVTEAGRPELVWRPVTKDRHLALYTQEQLDKAIAAAISKTIKNSFGFPPACSEPASAHAGDAN